MNTETARSLVQPENETKAGNYFVSNYPPFSFWNQNKIPDVIETLGKPVPKEDPLGLYVHIPFCRKRCHFCYFRVYTDKNAAQIAQYTDAVLKELKFYSKQAAIQGRKPKFVYFGGGTPSYLSAKQLRNFTDGIKEFMPWDEAEEVAFECEPGTLNEKKLEVLRDIGITRLSLGIENFSDEVLELNGRAHLSEEISRAYSFAKSLKFPQINIDLIAGMMGETEENWKYNIKKIIELNPHTVTIYQMEVPHNTNIRKKMREEGTDVAPVADWETKRRWVSSAFDALEQECYTITSAYTASRDPEKIRFVYRDQLWTGADLLSVGVSSFSHIQGAHFQNYSQLVPYYESLAKDEYPHFRAYIMDEEEKLIRELILLAKLGKLDCSYFQNKFGVDILEKFKSAFDELSRSGFLTTDGQYLILSREALLQVDGLLHPFFLQNHQESAYF